MGKSTLSDLWMYTQQSILQKKGNVANLIESSRETINARKNENVGSSVFYLSIRDSDKEGHMSFGNNLRMLIRTVKSVTCHEK